MLSCTNTTKYTILLTTLMLAMVFTIQVQASASYAPHPGDRARQIIGKNLFTSDDVSLDDFAGKWVLLVFWSSACPPCKRELDGSIQQLQQESIPNLKIVLVNLDTSDVSMIARHSIANHSASMIAINGSGTGLISDLTAADQPDTVSPIALDWGIRGVPATYLLDPQQNIVAKHLRGDTLLEAVKHFTGQSHNHPPIGLRTCYSVSSDDEVEIVVDLYNPMHENLDVQLDYIFITLKKDNKGNTMYAGYGYNTTNPGQGIPEYQCVADCSSGYSVILVPIDCTGFDGLEYRVQVLMPGTTHINNGTGLWLRQAGEVFFDFPEYSYEYAN